MNAPQWFVELVAEHRDNPTRLWDALFDRRIDLDVSWVSKRNAIPVWDSWPFVDDSAGAKAVREHRWKMKDWLYADWEQEQLVKVRGMPREISEFDQPERESQTRS